MKQHQRMFKISKAQTSPCTFDRSRTLEEKLSKQGNQDIGKEEQRRESEKNMERAGETPHPRETADETLRKMKSAACVVPEGPHTCPSKRKLFEYDLDTCTLLVDTGKTKGLQH